MNYECTIHTLRLHGDDGASYRVVLDLIRSNKNPSWGVDEDRLALRAAVLDSSGQAIGSVFVDTPKSNFEPTVGRMLSLGEQRNISFVAARAPDGSMIDGTLDFDLHVDILQSGFVQTFADKVKASLERALDNVGPSAQSKAPLPLQLLVTDYPHTRHTGTVAVKLPGKDEPLVLKADATRSTMSHHYGNALTEYVFLASVPQEQAPNFIAVITKEGLDLFKHHQGPEVEIPVGYILRTNEDGHASFHLLHVNAEQGNQKGFFEVGSHFWGVSLNIQSKNEAGSVLLNGGRLPARTTFGSATIHSVSVLSELGLSRGETFEDVLIDVTGYFLHETGQNNT